MKNTDQIYRQYAEMERNIQFYKQEINFLLKVIAKEYVISVNHREIIKLLNLHWKAFEKYLQKLKELESKITKRKNETVFLCKHEINSVFIPVTDEKSFLEEYAAITNSLKGIKRSLYSYMESEPRRALALSLL